MDLDSLTVYLKTRLKDPLPGLEASGKMSARFRIFDPERFRHSQPPRPGAVLILLYEQEGDIRFPLIQRSDYQGVHSGQMALPGGKREGDESDMDTAIREAEEEIGIDRNKLEIIGTLSSFYLIVSNFQIRPIVARTIEVPKLHPQETEVAEIIAARMSHFLDDNYVKERTISPTQGITLDAPYFDLEGKMVWGATAMMLNEFREILKEHYYRDQ